MDTIQSLIGTAFVIALIIGPLLYLNQRQKDRTRRAQEALGKCQCGASLRSKKKMTTTGWVLVIAGLFLAPIGIGILLIIYGATRTSLVISCPTHGPVVYQAIAR